MIRNPARPYGAPTLAVLSLTGMALLLGACAPTRKAGPVKADAAESAKKQEIHNEQRAFIAHEFFLRARQQEMEGNDAVALSYFQIAYEYDPESRDLCFLLTEKLKAAGKMDSALVTGLRCLDLKGKPDSREFQAVAEIHLRKGDVQSALAYYNKAVELDDQDKDLLYTLATLYESLKDIPKHVAVMEKLLPRIEYPVRLVEKQGQNYRLLGRVDAVAKLYRTSWDKTANPLFGEKLASFYEDQEMYSSLLDVLRKLALENPENLHYELQKARAQILAGKPDSAMASYEALIKRSPEEREFLSPYATLLFERGKYAEAKEIFQKLIKSQPENPIYHFFLGSIGMELRDRALAEGELKKAIDLDGKVPEYWAKLASFHIREGQEQKALDLLEKMGEGKDWYACYIQGIVFTQVAKKLETDQKPDSTGKARPSASRDTGMTSQTRRFREKGVDYFRKALELEGNNRRVLFELGVALEQIGKRAESIEVMKKLVKLDSSDATILNYLGYMLVEEGRELDYAGNLIERALNFEPENGAFLDSKGWLFYRKQDFPKAKKFIEMAVNHIPQDTTILEHYALILEKMGLSDLAMEKWRQILKLDPAHELAHRKLN
ncbi:MAG: Tetratricopeptide 2 repeat protein [Fibrobacteres bacterium]|nr:Tetratricopeptide 2 repeat protein [Fibrobacterota bacterium]